MTGASYQIAVIPGDGIGTEVMPVALDALEAVAEQHGFVIEVTELDWGCERYAKTGALAPDGWIDELTTKDAILLGAVGYPGVPDHVSLWELLIPIRREFDQYVNLRPLRSIPGVPGALRSDPTIDMVIVRENTEGEYTQVGGRMFSGTPREVALQEAVFTRHGVERIVRYACELATTRRSHLVAATKSNGLVHSMPFWDQIVLEVAEDYDLKLEIQHVDALAARFVNSPDRLDVVVASNLFGDVLSDLGGAIIGGLGMAASGNINPDPAMPSMFEPVHGSAPDIAGSGQANPVGQILSAAMMLKHLGEPDAATDLKAAVDRAVGRDAIRTQDLGGHSDTLSVGAAIIRQLESPQP